MTRDLTKGGLQAVGIAKKKPMVRGVSSIFIMGFPSVRNYINIFGISSDQLVTI